MFRILKTAAKGLLVALVALAEISLFGWCLHLLPVSHWVANQVDL